MLTSCFRLDDLLYEPTVLEGDYLLNDISKEELVVPAEFLSDESKTHLFTLDSKNEDGGIETIYAAYVGDTNRISTDTVFLYCHGNSYNIDIYWQRILLFTNMGEKYRYGAMIFDYQGFGKSTGTPHEQSLYNDTEACLRWLKDKGLSSDRLIIYGFSMGSAPATNSCSNSTVLTPQKLMLEAPFASAAQLVNDATPLDLPGSFVTSLYIDNGTEIKDVNQPFFWIHGEADTFLSRKKHGQIVYNNYKGSYKEKVLVEGAGHSDVPEVYGLDLYMNDVEQFIKR